MALHCLAGAGHGIASGVRCLGDPEFDGAAFASGAFFSTRLNEVGQTFERRLAAIDYKASRQQLHREDIRDLIELTTKRMDIYHLVGTLLLAFVMGWYTDNTIWELPCWFSDLFIISNYSAVGYLIMTVWMAMYAAIAARSIGTRLLTSYARLSLPTHEELHAIKNPVLFGATTEFVKRKLFRSSSSETDPDVKAYSGGVPDVSNVLLTFDVEDNGMELEGATVVKLIKNSEAQKQGVRPGWRIIGVGTDPFTEENYKKVTRGGKPYDVIFNQDEIIVNFERGEDPGMALDGETVMRIKEGSQAQKKQVRIGWKIAKIEVGGDSHEFSEDVFRQAQNGFSDYQIRFDQAVKYSHSEDHNQHFRVFLEQLPQWLVYDTWSRVCLSFGMNQLLQALSYFSLATLWPKSPLIAIMSFAGVNFLSHIVMMFDLGDIQKDLSEGLAVFVFHVLPASSAVALLVCQSLYPSNAVGEQVGERHLESALCLMCFVLHAGWLGYLVKVFSDNVGNKSAKFQPATFVNVLEWIPESKKIVRQGRTIEKRLTQSSRRLTQAAIPEEDSIPKRVSTTSIRSTTNSLQEEEADEATQEGRDGFDCCGLLANESNDKETDSKWLDDKQAAQRASEVVDKDLNGGKAPGIWMQSDRKHHYTDTDLKLKTAKTLPVKLLRLFTLVTIAWWLIAGITHSLIISFDRYNVLKDFTGSNNMAPLTKKHFVQWPHPAANVSFLDLAPLTKKSVQWPQPASLFKVAGLYCDDSQVLVNSGFSVYAMSDVAAMSSRALNFVKEGNVGSVICGAHRCNTLSPPDGQGSWTLGPLQPLGGGEAPVSIPHTWRQVAGAWMNCPASADAACASAKIAGWDGARVFVASLTRSAAAKTWQAHPQFEVDPAVGLCAESPKACAGGPETYGDVRALHMSESGRVLMILLGSGLIDIWDLSKGIVAKRMALGTNFTSMCQSGKNIYLSREDGSSPILETTGLPSGIAELLQSPSRKRPLALLQRLAAPSTLSENHPSKRLQRLRH